MSDDEGSIDLMEPAGDDPAGQSADVPDENDAGSGSDPKADTKDGDGLTTDGGGSGGVCGMNADNELEDLRSRLRDRDLQIESLERNRQKQDESIALLRSELGAVQIKHKEECYWLRLEVDNLRKDKEALEDRMAELYRDMREIDNMNEADDLHSPPVCVDSGYVLHLQSQLSKSMQTMGVLDNQIGMVKRSCDEVVKSLKEEIADVMDDKCRIEMELLNQLAVLDNEKRSLEDEYDRETHLRDERIRGRDDVIQTLREKAEDLEKQLADAREQARTASGEESREARERVKASVDRAMMSCSAFDTPPPVDEEGEGGGGGGGGTNESTRSVLTSSFDDTGWRGRDGEDGREEGGGNKDELAKRVEELERENTLLEDKLREERDAMEETSDRLRQNLEEQDERIERLTDELEEARASGGAAAADAEAVLEAVHRDRDEALETLERVAEVWEKADEAIQVLGDTVEDLRDNEDDEDDDGRRTGRADRERVLSTLETAALVHSQIKVSLLLVELKLRNQLTTLRNDGKLPTALEGGVGVARPGGPSGQGSVAANSLDETSLAELISHVDDVQRETLDSLEDLEKVLLEQIEHLERQCDGETEELEELRAEMGDKIDALLELKEKNEELEAEMNELEKKLDETEGEKKELGRKNRELKGRAADMDHGTSEMRRELEKLEQENADLTRVKKALEKTRKDLDKAHRDLEKAKKDHEKSLKDQEKNVKDMERSLKDMELSKKELEENVGHYRKEAKEAKMAAKESAKKAADAEKSMNGSTTTPSIDPMQLKMFEKLQKEILAVVGKIKEKNEQINKLNSAVEEHKVREAALRKELKRIMKRVRAIEEGGERGGGERGGSGDRRSGSFRREKEERR